MNKSILMPKYEELVQEPVGEERYVYCKDGTKIRVIMAGEGKTVVLAHGYGGSAKDWNLIFNRLVKEGFRVITFDQRGHLKSTIGSEGATSEAMANDYHAIFEQLDVKNALLVGHSMGGFLGIIYLLSYPLQISITSLLLLSSFAGNIGKNNPFVRFQIPVIKSGIMIKVMQNTTLRHLIGRFSVGKKVNPSIVKASTENFMQQPHQQLIPVLRALAEKNYYSRLSEIQIPCTVLTGTSDNTIPYFHSVKLSKAIKDAKLELVASIGHLFYWEYPEKVITEIKQLLEYKKTPEA
jgi:pimeloyl-ACP methyl ester carboxylesterase